MTTIPIVEEHGAREIEFRCPICHFVTHDPRRAVLVDGVLGVTCPRCDHHEEFDCKAFRKPTESRRP